MPRVHKQKAKSNIYRRGLHVEDKSTKSGKRINRSKPADENDTVFIPKGTVYYKWTFRYGGTHRSTTYPRQSQLTGSAFLQQAYGIQEQIEDFTAESISEIEDFITTIIDECQALSDECQESRDNMPEQLQDAPTGEMLGERVDGLENFISELESVFIDEENDVEETIEELQGLSMEIY